MDMGGLWSIYHTLWKQVIGSAHKEIYSYTETIQQTRSSCFTSLLQNQYEAIKHIRRKASYTKEPNYQCHRQKHYYNLHLTDADIERKSVTELLGSSNVICRSGS